jgi:hypothetical protein
VRARVADINAGARTLRRKKEATFRREMITKYFVAMCLLAIPVAMSAAPTPAEAGFRDAFRCHFVKKTSWFHGHKRTHWVKVCNYRHR